MNTKALWYYFRDLVLCPPQAPPESASKLVLPVRRVFPEPTAPSDAWKRRPIYLAWAAEKSEK